MKERREGRVGGWWYLFMEWTIRGRGKIEVRDRRRNERMRGKMNKKKKNKK